MDRMQRAERSFISPAQERTLMWLSVGLISLIAFEALAVATSMPTVVRALHGENLYALAMGVVMATQLITTAMAGPWSDSKGPQSCLYTGIGFFMGGLVICTFAPSMYLFVLGRAIQGLGGGLCVVPLYTIIGSCVRPARQPAFFAAFSAAWVVPALVGPAIAGVLVKYSTWRLVFGIVPVLLLIAFPFLVRVLRGIAHTPNPDTASGVHRKVMYALAAGFSVAVLQVLSGTRPGAFSPAVIAAIMAAALLTFLFIKPLLPRGTFVSGRGLASTVLVRGLTNGTFIGVETFLPLLLQEVHGWEATGAGLVLTAGSVTWALGSGAASRVSDQNRRRLIPFVGTLTQLIGASITLVGTFAAVPGFVVVIGWMISGLGIGLVYPTMSVHALAMTRPENQGKTSSSLQLADTLGGAFCVAIAGIVFALIMPAQQEAFVGAVGLMALIAACSVVVARRVYPHPGSQEEQQMVATQAERA